MTVKPRYFVLLRFVVEANMTVYSRLGQPSREHSFMSQNFASHVRREAISNGITNAFFNGVIAWYLVKHRESIPVWGGEGLAMDFTATAIILVFIVSLIVIPLARRKAKRGDLPAATWQAGGVRDFLDFMASRNLAVCALLLGVMSAVIFVPPMLIVFELFSISTFSAQHFAIIKGLWAGLVAAGMVVAMVNIVAVKVASR